MKRIGRLLRRGALIKRLGPGLITGAADDDPGGIATHSQALHLNPNGLVINLISFNVGVEIGQFVALSLILLAMTAWRKTPLFGKTAVAANVLIMAAGAAFMSLQLAAYFLGGL